MKIRLTLFCVLALCFLNPSAALAVTTGHIQQSKKIESSFNFNDYFKKAKSIVDKKVAKAQKKLAKHKAKIANASAKAKAKAQAKGKGGKTGLVRIGILLMIVGAIAGLLLWILGIAGVGSFLFRLGLILVVVGLVLWLLGLVF